MRRLRLLTGLVAACAAAGLGVGEAIVALPAQAEPAPLTQPDTNPVTFPGQNPGQPNVTASGTTARLSNNALDVEIDTSNGVRIVSLTNKLTGSQVPLTARQTFSFDFGGQRYDLSGFTASAPVVTDIEPLGDTGSFADTYAGETVVVRLTPKASLPS